VNSPPWKPGGHLRRLRDPISRSPAIWVRLEFDFQYQIRAELKLRENGWSDLGAILSDPLAFRVDYSHKYCCDFTEFIHHVMFVFWKWPAQAAATLVQIITQIISKLDPEHWSFILLAAISCSTFCLLRWGTDFFHFAYWLSSFHLAYWLHLILLPHICVWLSCVCASMANDKKDNKGKTSTTWSSKDETILIETLIKQKLHQQKSTFLIPSYSILLHLIPLILGVRRE